MVGTPDRYHDRTRGAGPGRACEQALDAALLVYPRGKVQLEDKLVEGLDSAHAELQQREDLLAYGEEELPAPVVEAMEEASLKIRADLLGAVRMILDGQEVQLSSLDLPELEMEGLIALQVAVEGKSHDLSQFVYASDRRDLLERALGVLQPEFSRSDDGAAREMRAQLDDMVTRVGELRERLLDLEDAQDELIEARAKDGMEAATDTSDKPKPKPSDPDAPRPATTLTGPDLPEAKPLTTTLTGPDLPAPKPLATTLTGPDLPEAKSPATTLTGPDLPEAERPASTLGAPEPEPEAEAGDGAQAKRSWWRRPFG
ncbi:MAG TPA: hypothetical protein VLM79_09405 [Kofleriaceae bacterium]|nr:hypothetical protein [Kofleriaceae bacterium]